MEKKMRQANLEITAREALDALDDIRVAKNQIGPKTLLCPAQDNAQHKRTLNALGIKNIPRILPTGVCFEGAKGIS